MRELVTTRDGFAAQGNIYMRLSDLRNLVTATGDLPGDSSVTILEMNGKNLRGLRVVHRERVDDVDD